MSYDFYSSESKYYELVLEYYDTSVVTIHTVCILHTRVCAYSRVATLEYAI